jgi:lipoyl(octanoyl) transferase
MHGIAFNINTDLNYFKGIIPCGISEKNSHVCSVESITGTKQIMEDIKTALKSKFAQIFELNIIETK